MVAFWRQGFGYLVRLVLFPFCLQERGIRRVMCVKRAACHRYSVTNCVSRTFCWRERITNVKPIKRERDARLDFCVGRDADWARGFLSVGHRDCLARQFKP